MFLPHDSFEELFIGITRQAVNDIIKFTKYATPRAIGLICSSNKKSPTCPISPIEKWSVSEVKYAYEFLFSNYIVKRSDLSYSFKELCSLLNIPYDIMLNNILKELKTRIGFIPMPLFGITYSITTGTKNMAKLDNNLLIKLEELTKEGTMKWEHNVNDNQGCMPELISKEMTHIITYDSRLSINDSTMYSLLSSYEKNSESKKKYREYVLKIEVVDSVGKSTDFTMKRVGRLFRFVDSKEAESSLTSEAVLSLIKGL